MMSSFSHPLTRWALLRSFISLRVSNATKMPLPPRHRGSPFFVPKTGADIKTEQYSSILSDLQEKVDFPLWVGIPQCPADVAAIPFGLKSGIERIGKAMVEQVRRARLERRTTGRRA